MEIFLIICPPPTLLNRQWGKLTNWILSSIQSENSQKQNIMKDFMMIFIGSTYEELGLEQNEIQERMGKWMAWGNKMGEAGILKGGHALMSNIRRVTGPNRTVSDGPFVESKEMVGGYYIVTAENVEEVMKIAEDYPDYDVDGTVEIREIMVFDQ